jgi:ribosomal protein L28
MFMPNIQRSKVLVDGRRKRLNICTRCLRTQVKVAAK